MMPKKIYFKRKLKKNNIYCHKYIKILSIFMLIIVIYFSFNIKSNYEVILNYPKFLIEEYKKIFDLLNKKKTFDLFRKKNKIENIFILISIFPFLKKEIIITKKNPIYDLFNFKNNKIIKINRKNKKYISLTLKYLINYKWENLPNKNKTNYIRHILYHYYPEKYLYLYEKSLNKNMMYYIQNNREKISYEFIIDLMSKI